MYQNMIKELVPDIMDNKILNHEELSIFELDNNWELMDYKHSNEL